MCAGLAGLGLHQPSLGQAERSDPRQFAEDVVLPLRQFTNGVVINLLPLCRQLFFIAQDFLILSKAQQKN